MNKTSIHLLHGIGMGKNNPKELQLVTGIGPAQFSILIKALLEQNYVVKKGSEFHPSSSAKYSLFMRISSRQDVEKILGGSNEKILKRDCVGKDHIRDTESHRIVIEDSTADNCRL